MISDLQNSVQCLCYSKRNSLTSLFYENKSTKKYSLLLFLHIDAVRLIFVVDIVRLISYYIII